MGDAAPDFVARTTSNDRYVFGTAAGRYLVLCFFGSSAIPHCRAALDHLTTKTELFNDHKASFFGITIDPADESEERVKPALPG